MSIETQGSWHVDGLTIERVIAVDWSKNPGTTYYVGSDRPTQAFSLAETGHGSFLEWLGQLPPNTLMVVETTFESKYLPNRALAMRVAEERGVILRVISPRKTPRIRVSMGKPVKTDADDALAIMKAVLDGVVELAAPRIDRLIPEKATHSAAFQALISLTEWDDKRFDKPLAMLPLVSELRDTDTRAVLCNPDGKGYARSYVTPYTMEAIAIVKKGGSTADFDRAVGNNGHGYPNVLRATFMRRAKTIVKQRLKVRSMYQKAEDGTRTSLLDTHKGQVAMKKAMQDLTRGTRMIFTSVRRALKA